MRLGAIFSSLVLPLAVLSHPSHGGDTHAARHHQLAKRAAGNVTLYKRFSDARWTFYDVGLGACGDTNVASDFIVALNSDQYGSGYPGPNCFKSITMTYNGKTTTAVIMDECPGCPYGGLDLSRGLFSFFAAESVGVLYGEWSFNDGSSDDTPKTTKTTPKATPTTTKKTTTTPKAEPTTTSTHKSTTTTKAVPSTTSTSTSKSSSSSTKSSSSSAAPTSSKTSSSLSVSKTSSAVPTPSVVQQSNLQDLSQVFIGLGGLVVAGAA